MIWLKPLAYKEMKVCAIRPLWCEKYLGSVLVDFTTCVFILEELASHGSFRRLQLGLELGPDSNQLLVSLGAFALGALGLGSQACQAPGLQVGFPTLNTPGLPAESPQQKAPKHASPKRVLLYTNG